MGVADNKTYRDQYHFKDDFSDTQKDNPSINGLPKINTTIKENPYRSNVEIEGGELVLQPDLTALFKAQGKKHSRGGMDVLLRPNAFIFSDFKDLAFTDKDKELMELKLGGSNKASKNTPAQVVKKNVDVKHYNTLINNISDPFKDDLAKKSSSMMLEKYIGTLGNIAYMQESKKQFPDGLPDFSMGTAPVYDADLKSKIDENKQYMKEGGKVSMQTGGLSPYSRWNDLNTKGRLSKAEAYEYRMLDEQMKRANQQPTAQPTVYDWQHPFGPQPAPAQFPVVPEQTKPRVSLPPTRTPQQAQSRRPLANGVLPSWLWTGDLYDKGLSPEQKGKSFDKLFNSYENIFTNPEVKELAKDLPGFKSRLKDMGIDMDSFKDAKGFQEAVFNYDKGRGFSGLKSVFNEYGNTLQGRKLGITKPVSEWTEDDFRKAFVDNKGGVRTLLGALTVPGTPKINIPDMTSFSEPPQEVKTVVKPPPDKLTPGEPQGPVNGVKRADWDFTPWQKISQLYNWGQYANTRRYMPARSRYNATYADPTLLNPEQTVGDVKGLANQQLNALGTLSPIMRNAQASAAYGQALNQIPAIRTQYDNQNAQISNQFNQYNNQVRNNESLVNMGNDQNYYQQAVEGRKNFDNMRQYTSNNAMNNTLRDVETNQKLAYNMLTLNNPAYGYDWKTGDFYRNKKDIRDSASNAQADLLSGLFSDYLADPMKFQSLDPRVQAALIKTSAVKGLNLNPTPLNQKKGGKVKNPYK